MASLSIICSSEFVENDVFSVRIRDGNVHRPCRRFFGVFRAPEQEYASCIIVPFGYFLEVRKECICDLGGGILWNIMHGSLGSSMSTGTLSIQQSGLPGPAAARLRAVTEVQTPRLTDRQTWRRFVRWKRTNGGNENWTGVHTTPKPETKSG